MPRSFTNSGFANLATAFGVPRPTLNGQAIDDTYKQSSNNWALFTHNIFDITDQLSLTVGARYTHEKKKLCADLQRQQYALHHSSPAGPLASAAGTSLRQPEHSRRQSSPSRTRKTRRQAVRHGGPQLQADRQSC